MLCCIRMREWENWETDVVRVLIRINCQMLHIGALQLLFVYFHHFVHLRFLLIPNSSRDLGNLFMFDFNKITREKSGCFRKNPHNLKDFLLNESKIYGV